eukprot:gene4490-8931_t
MGILDLVFRSDEPDDPFLLPTNLVPAYQNPHRILGLDDTATVSQIRDAYRKSCICLIEEFSGLHNPKVTIEQLTLAYHLLRKNLTGPAKKLAKELDTTPYLQNIHATDILPLLRPTRSSFACPVEYRGFRQLTVLCDDYRTTFSSTGTPITMYKFGIHYCMRKHNIEKDFDSVFALHKDLSKELLLIPTFPVKSSLHSISPQARGNILSSSTFEAISSISNDNTHQLITNLYTALSNST